MVRRAAVGAAAGNEILGAADYKLVHHANNGRSVYSFCMCPGGTVVAATSEPGRVVTNGMSQYSRNERNANAGIVVGIGPADFVEGAVAGQPVHPLAGIAFLLTRRGGSGAGGGNWWSGAHASQNAAGAGTLPASNAARRSRASSMGRRILVNCVISKVCSRSVARPAVTSSPRA